MIIREYILITLRGIYIIYYNNTRVYIDNNSAGARYRYIIQYIIVIPCDDVRRFSGCSPPRVSDRGGVRVQVFGYSSGVHSVALRQ